MSVEDKATFSYRCGVRLVSYQINLVDPIVVLSCLLWMPCWASLP